MGSGVDIGKRVLAMLLPAVILCACAGAISDIRYVSIEKADYNASVIPHLRSPVPNDNRELLKLRFSTTVNLRAYVRDQDAFATLLTVTLCPLDEHRTIDNADIYYGGIKIDAVPETLAFSQSGKDPNELQAEKTAIAAEVAAVPPKNALLFYDAYIRYGLVFDFDPNDHVTTHWPISAEPPDLCFNVSGHVYMWPSFTSNIATIPHADLAAALVHTHP
jgi:hypothetical protein